MNYTKHSSKRGFIVTFKDPQVSLADASTILGVADVQDGVSIMATDADFSEATACHFEGLGSTFFPSLSDDKISRFQKDNRVLSVEEDIEVFALYDDRAFADTEPGLVKDFATQYFDMGYNQGVIDTKKNLSEAFSKFLENGEATTTGIRIPLTPIALPQPTPWNISMVKAPQAWARGIRGDGVKVAVIDTGIANHSDLSISGGACFVPGISSYNDDNGHGTHCAGVIGARYNTVGVIGVAPRSALYAVKVLNSAGSGQLSWILAGMAWALRNGMKVVSMSLGSPSAPIIAYQNAIAQLIAGGVNVVCASGNSFQQGFPYVGAPANSHPGVIAVGAVDNNKVISSFSCRGTNGPNWNGITVVAPGVSVNSTWPMPASSYKILSGTSMATPHVAGAVALVLQKFPNLTPQQIKAKLINSASDLGVPGYDATYGAGLLNCDAVTM